MSLGITQGTLDDFGTEMLSLMPIETLAYKTSGVIGSTTVPIVGRWIEYSQREKALNPLLLNFRLLRVDTPAFIPPPVRGGVLLQESGQAWEIQRTDGGPGHAYWFLQCRQVG